MPAREPAGVPRLRPRRAGGRHGARALGAPAAGRSTGWAWATSSTFAAWACVLGPAALVPFALACLAGAAASLARGRRTFPFAPWLSGLALVALAALPFSPPA
ncbi:MAG: hypothetical protein LKE37_08140 [Atopobiaceae bacterium]|nr:hypothetical protein [Atopobiaceae bacterium]